MNKKSREILKAIATAQSCEQALAADDTLTYHDVFHALSETPTKYWTKMSARKGGQRPSRTDGASLSP